MRIKLYEWHLLPCIEPPIPTYTLFYYMLSIIFRLILSELIFFHNSIVILGANFFKNQLQESDSYSAQIISRNVIWWFLKEYTVSSKLINNLVLLCKNKILKSILLIKNNQTKSTYLLKGKLKCWEKPQYLQVSAILCGWKNRVIYKTT